MKNLHTCGHGSGLAGMHLETAATKDETIYGIWTATLSFPASTKELRSWNNVELSSSLLLISPITAWRRGSQSGGRYSFWNQKTKNQVIMIIKLFLLIGSAKNIGFKNYFKKLHDCPSSRNPHRVTRSIPNICHNQCFEQWRIYICTHVLKLRLKSITKIGRSKNIIQYKYVKSSEKMIYEWRKYDIIVSLPILPKA